MVYIGVSHSVDFIRDFPIVIGKPMRFGDSWRDPPVLLPPLYHSLLLGLFRIFYTPLTSLNVHISRGLQQFQSLNLAESAQVTRIRKDNWTQAASAGYSPLSSGTTAPHIRRICLNRTRGLNWTKRTSPRCRVVRDGGTPTNQFLKRPAASLRQCNI